MRKITVKPPSLYQLQNQSGSSNQAISAEIYGFGHPLLQTIQKTSSSSKQALRVEAHGLTIPATNTPSFDMCELRVTQCRWSSSYGPLIGFLMRLPNEYCSACTRKIPTETRIYGSG